MYSRKSAESRNKPWEIHGMKRGLRSPLSNQILLQFSSPSNSGLQVPNFTLSILHVTPRNIFNGEMDGGHIWFWSTIKNRWKRNISNGRFQTISKIKSVWLWQCSDKWFSVNKRNGDGPHRIYPLPIQQMELPDVH